MVGITKLIYENNKEKKNHNYFFIFKYFFVILWQISWTSTVLFFIPKHYSYLKPESVGVKERKLIAGGEIMGEGNTDFAV